MKPIRILRVWLVVSLTIFFTPEIQAYYVQWSTDVGNSAYGIAIGNTDNDAGGTNELVIFNAEYLTVYSFNSATNSYDQQWQTTDHACYDYQKEVVIADTDNDGNNEIAVANHGDFSCSRRVYFYEYNGTTYLQQGYTAASPRATDSVAVGDVNADGENEVVVGTTDGKYYGHVRVLKWNGSDAYEELWSFGDPTTQGYGNLIYGNHVRVGDCDNDGSNEILVGDYFGELFVFKWDGATFQQQWNDDTADYGWNAFGLTVGDSNNDGENEIIFGGGQAVAGSTGYIGTRKWDGATYDELDEMTPNNGVAWFGLAIGDSDNDGENELVAGNFGGTLFVLNWNSDSSKYTQELSADLTSQAWGVTIGDADNDGENELVVGNQNGQIYVYKKSEDSDGDALPDDWEENGIDIDNDGTIDLDLPAMGADPYHKDIFVEVDYMKDDGTCLFGLCYGGHSHKPKSSALKKVIKAFENAPVDNPDGTTGIRLHIDAGSSSIMNPKTNEKWGSLSDSDKLSHEDKLDKTVEGQAYDWTKFFAIKADNFSESREPVFHYCLSVHELGYYKVGTSGLASVPGGNFILAMGNWDDNVGSTNDQAGTFMHELGHNLGLCHGGDDDNNYKPNYLSIMNYWFQTGGLRIDKKDGNFDFSRIDLPNLNENSLNENIGCDGPIEADSYGTKYFCPVTYQQKHVDYVNNAIDWDCDGVTESNVSCSINWNETKVILTSYNDWDNLVFSGGGIGSLGIAAGPSMEKLSDDPDSSELTRDEDNQLIRLYDVNVSGYGNTTVEKGSDYEHEFTVSNKGEYSDTYTLTSSSAQGWTDFSQIPSQVLLNPNETITYTVGLKVPASASSSTIETIIVTATSQANENIADSAEIDVTFTDSNNQEESDDSSGGGGGGACFIDILRY